MYYTSLFSEVSITELHLHALDSVPTHMMGVPQAPPHCPQAAYYFLTRPRFRLARPCTWHTFSRSLDLAATLKKPGTHAAGQGTVIGALADLAAQDGPGNTRRAQAQAAQVRTVPWASRVGKVAVGAYHAPFFGVPARYVIACAAMHTPVRAPRSKRAW